ncbi:hypothetical protein WH297_19650 [Ochrobactrum vermis]|uniref:Transposase n=1 Tax=Ochrobactrum vermis TaxID=1827297 RepID=A0ABU8PIN6_9HYPH|nr:hypothetical protein [Ochrobactrum vermis]
MTQTRFADQAGGEKLKKSIACHFPLKRRLRAGWEEISSWLALK